MRLATIILITLIFMLTRAQANDYIKISKQLAPLLEQNDILIIGETHRKSESTKLFKALTNYITQNNTCIAIVLEIRSDQQSVIDKAMSANGSISDIKISTIIDHLGYREMLSSLRSMVAEGRCLKVIAIDGYRKGETRDTWMAEKVSPLLDKGKVLALLGSHHAIKKIRWESGKYDPFLAERLVAKGYDVCSVMQLWGVEGNGKVTKLTVNDAAKVLSPVAAFVPIDASEFGDYVIRWK